MKNLTIILVVVLLVEITFFALRERALTQLPAVPELDFQGYSAFTQRQIETRIDSADLSQASGWTDVADTLFAAGFYAESEACYRQAAEIDPDHPQLRYNWAFCLSSLGNVDASDEQFQKAIDLGHSHSEACRHFMGLNALRQGRREDAVRLFDESDELAASQVELAQLAIEDGNHEIAESILKGLLEEEPNAWRVHHLQAILAREIDDPDGYVKHSALADVLRDPVSGPWHSRAAKMQELSLSFDTRTQVEDTLAALSNGRQPAPFHSQIVEDIEQLWDPALEDVLSDLEVRMENPEQQIERLQRIVERDGLNSYRAARLGFALLAQGNEEEGIEILKQGIQLQAGYKGTEVTDMASFVANHLREQGQNAEADTYLALGQFLNGLDLMDQLSVPSATVAFRKAIEVDKSSARYWFWLGRTQQLLNERSDAIKSYDECLKLNPYHERATQYREALNSASDQ